MKETFLTFDQHYVRRKVSATALETTKPLFQ